MRRSYFYILAFTFAAGFTGCDSDGQEKGESRFFAINVDGVTRTFEAYIPGAIRDDRPATVLLAFHGSPGNSAGMRQSTGLNAVADDLSLIVVYPNSIGSWAPGCDCTDADFEGVDDISYVSGVMERLAQEYVVDSDRLFSLGFSQGGLFSYRLGCSMANRLAGVLALGASMSWHQAETCEPDRPIPVFTMLGTEDRAIPWGGTGRSGGQLMPIDSTQAFWAQTNGCDPTPDVTTTRKVDAGRDVRTHTFLGCEQEVVLHAVVGMDHAWAETANEQIKQFLTRN